MRIPHRLVIIAVIVAAIATGLIWLSGQRAGQVVPTPSSGSSITDVAPVIGSAPSKNEYEASAQQIVAPLLALIAKSDPTIAQESTNVKAKLLGLKVPTDYKDVHLRLVIALSNLEAGNERAAKGQAELVSVTNDFPWLKP